MEAKRCFFEQPRRFLLNLTILNCLCEVADDDTQAPIMIIQSLKLCNNIEDVQDFDIAEHQILYG